MAIQDVARAVRKFDAATKLALEAKQNEDLLDAFIDGDEAFKQTEIPRFLNLTMQFGYGFDLGDSPNACNFARRVEEIVEAEYKKWMDGADNYAGSGLLECRIALWEEDVSVAEIDLLTKEGDAMKDEARKLACLTK